MSVYQSPSHRPEEISDLEEANDVTVLKSQLSSDELVSNEDISTTHTIIEAGREEDEIAKLEEDGAHVEYKEDGQVVVSFNLWTIVRRGAINLILPFINGIMLGFGEIFAHEVGFRYGFVGARVQPPRRQVLAPPKPKYI